MMLKQISLLLLIACTFILVGCTQPKNRQQRSQNRGHKKQYGRIYQTTDGTTGQTTYYTRSHHDNEFWYWMYVDSSPPISVSSNSNNSLSGGNWVHTTAIPVGAVQTSRVVEEQEGQPETELEESSQIQGEETIDETTTESQVESAESSGSESSPSSDTSGESSSGDSGSGDSGGDSSGGGGDGGD